MKINIAILASGQSQRFKSNKLLYQIKGISMIEHVFKIIQHINCEVVVVTCYEEVIQLANRYHYAFIMNYHSNKGMSESVKLATAYFKESDGILFMMGDQPYIHPTSIQTMMNQADPLHILRARYQDKISSPALFPKQYFNELLEVENDEGGRPVIRNHASMVRYIDFEDEIELMDIDENRL